MFRIVVVLLFVMSPALAADQRPGFSIVYDTKENSGLKISCTDASPNEVKCDLKQISIFKKAKEGQLQQEIEEARQQFRSAPKTQMDPKECSHFENTLIYLRGGNSNLSADVKSNLQKLTGRERQDAEQNIAMLVAFCKNPTEETLTNITRYSYEKKTKTCSILTAQFSQVFQRVTGDSWVSNEGPDGLCGVVTVSRLERVSAGSSSFWVYTTKRVVTNKAAASSPKICGSLDESEHFFDWKGGGDRFVGCDYIEMGF
jgi:hypothetical protein